MRYIVQELGVEVKAYEEWECDVVDQVAAKYVAEGKPGKFGAYLEKATWPLFAAEEVEPIVMRDDIPEWQERVPVPPPVEFEVYGEFY